VSSELGELFRFLITETNDDVRLNVRAIMQRLEVAFEEFEESGDGCHPCKVVVEPIRLLPGQTTIALAPAGPARSKDRLLRQTEEPPHDEWMNVKKKLMAGYLYDDFRPLKKAASVLAKCEPEPESDLAVEEPAGDGKTGAGKKRAAGDGKTDDRLDDCLAPGECKRPKTNRKLS